MIKLLFILLSIFSLGNSFSQVESHQPTKTQEEYNLQKDADWKAALKNIEQLKTGTLLVALDLQSKKVEYYRKYNNERAAEKLASKQMKASRFIVSAIDSLYKFSSFYYFDIDDLERIKSKDYDQVRFYNSNLENDKSIRFPEGFFLIGNFGMVSEDYNDGAEYATKNNVNAFVLRDSELNQLRRPFPYYSTYFPNASSKKRYILPTRRFQENLEQFEKTGEVRFDKREKRRSKKRNKTN